MKIFALLFLSISSFLLDKAASEWPKGMVIPYEAKVDESVNEVKMEVKFSSTSDAQSLRIYFSNGEDLNAAHLKLTVTREDAGNRFHVSQAFFSEFSSAPAEEQIGAAFPVWNPDTRGNDAYLNLTARVSDGLFKITLMNDFDLAVCSQNVSKIQFVRVEGENVNLRYVITKPKIAPNKLIEFKMVSGLRVYFAAPYSSQNNKGWGRTKVVLNVMQGGSQMVHSFYRNGYGYADDSKLSVHRKSKSGTWKELSNVNHGSLTVNDKRCFSFALDFLTNSHSGSGEILVHILGKTVGTVKEFDGYTLYNTTAELQAADNEGYVVEFWRKFNDTWVTVDPVTGERLIPVTTSPVPTATTVTSHEEGTTAACVCETPAAAETVAPPVAAATSVDGGTNAATAAAETVAPPVAAATSVDGDTNTAAEAATAVPEESPTTLSAAE